MPAGRARRPSRDRAAGRARRRSAGAGPAPAAPQAAPQPDFRVSVDLITTDMIVRDQKSDQFIADLKPGEIEVYEDGVKQDIASLELMHGGRAYSVHGPAAGAGAGRHHPAAQPADQRHGRPRVPALHRRPAPRLPRDAAHARAAEEHAEEPDSRRRHVRHRHHRHVVDLDAAHLRPAGARFGGVAHHRQRAQAEGDHRGRRRARTGPPSCATARTWRSPPPTI